jgi:multidrug resistance efflux pump
MDEINRIEVHSEEIQELMGFIPNRLIRWGLAIIFTIFSGVILGAFFIKSPEIITAPMVLTTKNPPIVLLSKSTGRIDRLFVRDAQFVNAGTIIALINNPTDYSDFLLLKEKINIISNGSLWDGQVFNIEFPDKLTLGELQSAYSLFIKGRNNFKHYLTQNLIPQKIELLKKQIAKQREYYQMLLKQKAFITEDLSLAEKSVMRDSLLLSKGSISETDYEKAKQNLLSKKSSSAGFDASLKNTESSIFQMQGSSVELQMQFEKELNQFRLDLEESKQNMKNLLHQWEEKYLIKSPVTGVMTYTSVWSEKQEVKTGDLIGTVIPQGAISIIAKAVIPTAGFGKVEVGQRVNIKLSGFPFMEFGMLRGHIRSVSLVPEEKGYVAEIDLEEGMTSSYKENLKFIQQMDGTAEIITKDLRLIYRFVNPLKALFDKG